MKKFFLLLIYFSTFYSFSQTDSGDLEAYLNTIISSMPGDSGDNYTLPSNSELISWENMIDALFIHDLVTARSHADTFNYEVVEYSDTAQDVNGIDYYVVKEKSTQSKYWGTYVLCLSPISDLVIQAPHSSFDFNTGKQAVYNFVRLQNRALFLNGTHRCNHSQASTCSGTTSVCSGSSEPFRISDLAHHDASIWQKTTEVVFNTITDPVFLQLHGFTKLASDPYVILSNGTDQTPSGIDYTVALKNELFAQDNSLTFKIAHIDNWTRLVGFTNTQGRFINNSSDPCGVAATSTTGRFIHLEQEKTKLRDDSTGWNKLFLALEEIFNHLIGVEDLVQFKMNTQNPFQNSIDFSAENVTHISLFSLTGKELYSSKNTSGHTEFSIETHSLSSGIYMLKVTTSKGIATKKLIRE